MDLLTVFQNIGMFTVGTGIFAFLVKSLINNSLNKDIERFKTGLNNKTEEFKSTLERTTIEHQIRYARLHEERALVMRELYSKLIKMEDSLRQCMAEFIPAGENAPTHEELEKKAAADTNTFYSYFRAERIFFNKNLCELVDSIFSTVKNTWEDFTKYPYDINEFEQLYGRNMEPHKDRSASMKRARDMVKEEFPKLKEMLEDEFRELLGVSLK